MGWFDNIFGSDQSEPNTPPVGSSIPQTGTPTPQFGAFGLGPTSWGQKIGLLLSSASDAINSSRGVRSDNFQNNLAMMRDMARREALMSFKPSGDPQRDYASLLSQTGDPETALSAADAPLELQSRSLSAASSRVALMRQLGQANMFRRMQGKADLSEEDAQALGFPPGTATAASRSGAPAARDSAQPSVPSQPLDVPRAILGQESGNNPNAPTSVDGAIGPGQVTPATWQTWSKLGLVQPGEKIGNPATSTRAINYYLQKFGNDPNRAAVAYFSGPGNVAPAGSATPFIDGTLKDGNGKTVASYVSDVAARLAAQRGNASPGNQVANNTTGIDPAAIGEANPELGMELLQKRRTPMTPAEQAAFVQANPGANPDSTWGRDWLGNPIEIIKSDTKTPAAQQQDIDRTSAEARARSEGAVDAINQVAPGYMDAQARQIATYRAAPITVSSGRNNVLGPAIMARALAINPNYDQRNYGASNKVVSAFDSGKQGDTVRSLNVAIQHMGTLQTAATALQNGDVKALNGLRQVFQDQFGSPIPNNFDAVRNLVADEVTKAVLGGAGALGDRDQIRDTLSRASSPGQLAGVLGNYTHLLAGQMSGLRQQFVSGSRLPESEFDSKLLPETQRALGMLTSAGGQPQSQPAQQTTAAPKFLNGQVYRDAHGNRALYHNGQWIPQ